MSGNVGPAGFSVTNNNNYSHWPPENIGSAMTQRINRLLDPVLFAAATSPTTTLQALTGILRDPYVMAQDAAASNPFHVGLRNVAASAAGSQGTEARATATLQRANQLLAYRQLQSAAAQSHLPNMVQAPFSFELNSVHDDLSRLINAQYGISDHASLHSATDIKRGHSLLSHYDAARLLGMNGGGLQAAMGDVARRKLLQDRIAAASMFGSLRAPTETALHNMIVDGEGVGGRRATAARLGNKTAEEDPKKKPPSDMK